MNKRETVQALMDSIQKGDFVTAKSMLADDFQFRGPIPESIEGAGLMAILQQLDVLVPVK